MAPGGAGRRDGRRLREGDGALVDLQVRGLGETRLARITDDLEEATGAATCTSVVDDVGLVLRGLLDVFREPALARPERALIGAPGLGPSF